MVAATEALLCGHPVDPATTVGPVIEQAARDRVLEAASSGAAVGGRVLTGGRAGAGEGWFVTPTVVDNLPADHLLVREEVFGPICALGQVDSVAEALDAANDVRYGLAASVFTADLDAALQFAEGLAAVANGIPASAPASSARRRRSSTPPCTPSPPPHRFAHEYRQPAPRRPAGNWVATSMTDLSPMVDAAAVQRALPMAAAIKVIAAALEAGFDPERAVPRSISEVSAGQVLSMPAEVNGRVGVKLATVAPGNPGLGLPRVQAVYMLMDGATLSPIALIDGTELTNLRTPAVSAVAIDRLATPEANHLVLFGTGPQAWGHVEALRAVRPISRVGVIARDRLRTATFVERVRGLGLGADVVACCTTAREPLFDGRLLADHAVVVACGSHEPTAREVDTETVRRSVVVVESVAAACEEAGDVIMAIAEGAVARSRLVGLAALVRGETNATTGPRLFKSVGMAWEDLVVAAAVFDQFAYHVRFERGAPP